MFSGTLAALQRSAAMRGLFRTGSTTSRQIFETEFGHFPPNGLDFQKDNGLDRPIQLKSQFKDKNSGWLSKALTTVAALGYVHGKEQTVGSRLKRAPRDETIYMNPVLMGLPGKMIGAFVTYSLASQLMSNVSPLGLLGYMKDHMMISLMVLGSPLATTPLTEIANLPFRSFSNVMGHEHIHILQIHDKKRAKTGYAMDDDRFKDAVTRAQDSFSPLRRLQLTTDRIFSLGTSRYLINDVEVQARLHTTIANGYHRWGRIPRTRHELWAACIDSGLNAPKVIRDEVASSSEEGVKDFLKPGLTKSFARAARGFTSPDTAELNAAQRSLRSNDLAQKHWDNTLPFMYGHLLELYGDPEGRAKMDYTKEVDRLGGQPLSKVTIYGPKDHAPGPRLAPRPPQWDVPTAHYAA